MLQLILLGLFIVVFALPGYFLGEQLHKHFPDLSMLWHVVIVSAPIIALVIWYLRRKGKADSGAVPATSATGGQPSGTTAARNRLSAKDLAAWLIIATPIGAALSHGSHSATLYIDNGTTQTVSVAYKDENLAVAPGSYAKLDVRQGKNDLSVNGSKRTLDLGKELTWVLNVDRQNAYYTEEVLYGDAASDGTRRSWWASDSSEQNWDLIKEELFSTKADYVFEEPESILVSKKSGKKKSVARYVLYRITRKELDAALKAMDEVRESDSTE